ncbi:MAG: type II/IV secretion system ATPase subunit [Candidatus Thermoplasmatota archaeon]|nr:type II/IV secretion system ATPase subunit [Candidatus Thermoplasmatota archaeon]
MKKDREKPFKKTSSSSKIDEKKLLEIEKKIDETITKNKETTAEKNLVERYSFKNKQGEAIYFLKEKKNNNTESKDLKEDEKEFIEEQPTNHKNQETNGSIDKKIDEIIFSKYDDKTGEIKTENSGIKKKEILLEKNKTVDKKTKKEKTAKNRKLRLRIGKKTLKPDELPEEEYDETEPQTDTNLLDSSEKDDLSLTDILTANVQENGLEHVFFDEVDISFGGWSPRITDQEKKDLALPFQAKPEIKNENMVEAEIPKELFKDKSMIIKELGLKENEWEELEFYPLKEPFAYVEILREKESLDKRYFLVEVDLDEEEQRLVKFITETLTTLSINYLEMQSTGDEKYLVNKVDEVIKEYGLKIRDESKKKILYYIEKSSLGLDKIDPLMRDPNIEDISCDGANIPIFLYHRKYGSLKSNIDFKSEDELSSFIFKLAQKCGKHISIAEPMLDATMPDGSRIQMTLSDEITAKGSTFTIRKFRENPFSPPDLVEFNTMSSEMLAYMWLAVENGVNTLIAGGTASGKTTVLNALSLFIPRESKIVSIEETREINLPHPNWIPGVARTGFGEIVQDKMVGEIDMYDLMKAALRQRPEYIIVGEIRGKEAYVLFQAMATGHATYSTVHADSAKSLIHRLEGKPIEIPRIMLQSLDIVTIHITTRVKGKRVRRCKQIIEIIDIDPTTKEILTNEAFHWDPVEDKFIYTGKSYVLEGIRARWDMNKEEIVNELRKRAEILEWMREKNVRTFKEVARVISKYAENPEEVMKLVKQKKDENVIKDASN